MRQTPHDVDAYDTVWFLTLTRHNSSFLTVLLWLSSGLRTPHSVCFPQLVLLGEAWTQEDRTRLYDVIKSRNKRRPEEADVTSQQKSTLQCHINICGRENRGIPGFIDRCVGMRSSEIRYSKKWRTVKVIEKGTPRRLDSKSSYSLLLSLSLRKKKKKPLREISKEEKNQFQPWSAIFKGVYLVCQWKWD